MKKNIVVILGTRPEATKLGTVINELNKYSDELNVSVITTGQHKEQLEQSLNAFNIRPDINLNVMIQNQTLFDITTRSLKGLEEHLQKQQPDLILVHGDTHAALCGSLASFFLKIPVAHVEAGLRSFNNYSPWPEEVNRKIVDTIAEIFFAPTEQSKFNLLNENIPEDKIFITGQTSVDAALKTYKSDYTFKNNYLNQILKTNKSIVTVTAHRRENYGENMENMFKAIGDFAQENDNVEIIYPVHLSKYVQKTAHSMLSNYRSIHLIEPLEYPDMINLIARSKFIVSDSGGLQEESSVFKVPLLLMRDTTERPEAVKANLVKLVGTDKEIILNNANKLNNDIDFYNSMKKGENPFGDGTASSTIVQIIRDYLSKKSK